LAKIFDSTRPTKILDGNLERLFRIFVYKDFLLHVFSVFHFFNKVRFFFLNHINLPCLLEWILVVKDMCLY